MHNSVALRYSSDQYRPMRSIGCPDEMASPLLPSRARTSGFTILTVAAMYAY